MEIQDYILVHGKIINIKNNVDDKYIQFDISKDEYYKDKDGHMKNNPSFFSARISKILSNKYILDTNIEVVVKGIPKGFIDKKGYRQNYIHVTELNNKGKFEFSDTKTKDSKHIVPITKSLLNDLKELYNYDKKTYTSFNDDFFVCSDCRPIADSTLYTYIVPEWRIRRIKANQVP